MYTDAEGGGHAAAVLFIPDGSVVFAHTQVPGWMMGCGIFERELFSVALGAVLACARYPGPPIVLCCDNAGAIGAIEKGSFETPMGSLLSSSIWKLVGETSTLLWVEFVRAGLNVADAPSRCVG